MSRINEIVVERIKELRKERGKTQQDLAEHLGKTAAAISDLERGKVQVSVDELNKISAFLEKPMEYFISEKPMTEGHETIAGVMKEVSPENIMDLSKQIRLIIKMRKFEKNLDPSDEEFEEFVSDFFSYYNYLRGQVDKMNEVYEFLNEELKKRKIHRTDVWPRRRYRLDAASGPAIIA